LFLLRILGYGKARLEAGQIRIIEAIFLTCQ